MKYSDGSDERLGDRLQLWERCSGIAVCSMDTDEYSAEYPKKDWGHLQSGVMIQPDKAGLFHYIEPDEDLQLIRRVGATGGR